MPHHANFREIEVTVVRARWIPVRGLREVDRFPLLRAATHFARVGRNDEKALRSDVSEQGPVTFWLRARAISPRQHRDRLIWPDRGAVHRVQLEIETVPFVGSGRITRLRPDIEKLRRKRGIFVEEAD